ncbi:hypothetical protein AB0953_16720 [Streptomyces sp. NPDC046866]|uniref:hypothetical protein n=1 Tax=Streptomyces sp. NPDC046866 TaxID=3154921 RepID=UPI003452D15E
MARIRSIKPEFFTSLTIAELPLSARLTFIGLWTYVDDNGVGPADARLIRAAIWPLEETPDILQRTREDLQRLHAARLIALYEDSGRPLVAVANWSEHQKVSHPRKNRFPRPEEVRDLQKGSTPEGLQSPPEDYQSPPETFRPEQGSGSRDQGAGKGTPSPPPAASASDPGLAFDAFWSAYPRKAGKSEAAKAYNKAIKAGAHPDRILAALKAHADYYRAAQTEQQFIPHASTWLNQARYEEDPPPPPRAHSGGTPTTPRFMNDEEKQRGLQF